tara:strand:+ start:210 stop:464 length:255 start_codon:yes stop_codon:yes gene_type:complete
MNEKYKLGAADRLLDRAEKDDTGLLRRDVSRLMECVKNLSKANVPLDEIAAIVTMFWHVGQNPEMEALMQAFQTLNPTDEKNFN